MERDAAAAAAAVDAAYQTSAWQNKDLKGSGRQLISKGDEQTRADSAQLGQQRTRSLQHSED